MSKLTIDGVVKSVKAIHKLYKNVESTAGEIVQPVGTLMDLESWMAKEMKNPGGDGYLLKHCTSDLLHQLYEIVILVSQKLIPKEWNSKNRSDWMYAFSKQIWALDAKRDDFGPVKHKDETAEENKKRRQMGAKAALSRVVEMIDLVTSAQELLASFAFGDNIKELAIGGVIGTAGAISQGNSAGGLCGDLAVRIAKISKGEAGRMSKLADTLQSLYTKLRLIVENNED